MKKLMTATVGAALAACLVGTAAVPAGAADAVSVRKISSKSVAPGKKATIKPSVRASGRVKLGTPRVTVRRKGRVVASNRTHVRLRAGTYRVTTSVRYRTYADRPTWASRTVAARGSAIDARCTFVRLTPRTPVTITPAPAGPGDVVDGIGNVVDGIGGAVDSSGVPVLGGVIGGVAVVVEGLGDVVGGTLDGSGSDGTSGVVQGVEDVLDALVPGLGGLVSGLFPRRTGFAGLGATATGTASAPAATVAVHDYTASCRWNDSQPFTVTGTLAGSEDTRRTVIGYQGTAGPRSVQVAVAPSKVKGGSVTLTGLAAPVALTRTVRTGTQRTYSAVKVAKRTQSLKVRTRSSRR